jgi:hypothetical protein
MVTISLAGFDRTTKTAIENLNGLLVALLHQRILTDAIVYMAPLFNEMLDERSRNATTGFGAIL